MKPGFTTHLETRFQHTERQPLVVTESGLQRTSNPSRVGMNHLFVALRLATPARPMSGETA